MERTPYWLIENGVLIDFLALPTLALFGYGVYLHWRRITKGETQLRISLDGLRGFFSRDRSVAVIWNGLLGARVYRWPVTGLFHGLVFWGMLRAFDRNDPGVIECGVGAGGDVGSLLSVVHGFHVGCRRARRFGGARISPCQTTHALSETLASEIQAGVPFSRDSFWL